jgi:branched-chain amino acid transport system permease protein
VLVGIVAALVVGALVGTVRLHGVFVAVSTWLVAWMTAFLLAGFPSLSGGSQGLVLPTGRLSFPGLGLEADLSETVHFELALLLLSLALLGFLAVSRGPLGLAMAAVRTGPSPASALGVRTTRLQLGALVAAAGIAGVAGALGVQLVGVADRTAYGPLLSVELFVAVLLGGTGRTLGPVVGAAILGLLPGVARGVGSLPGIGQAQFEPVLVAALLVVGLLLGRGGVIGLVEGVIRRFRGGAAPKTRRIETTRAESSAIAPRLGPATLEADGVSKHFGGVEALTGISFRVEPGTIHALIGPNGSGKTTLLRVLAGTTEPDTGVIRLAGRDITSLGPEERVHEGVVRTLQRTSILEDLSPLEHVMAGATAGRSYGGGFRTLFATPLARAETRVVRERAVGLLALAGIDPSTPWRARRLDPGEQRLLMVATAAASLPSVLLLDEPAAGLYPWEDLQIERFLKSLAAAGAAVVTVEHDFPLVERIADIVTVLDAGEIIAEGSPEEVRGMPVVAEAYLGTAG